MCPPQCVWMLTDEATKALECGDIDKLRACMDANLLLSPV